MSSFSKLQMQYVNLGQFSGHVHTVFHTKQVRRRTSPQGAQAAYTAAGRRHSCNMWRRRSSAPQTLNWTCYPRVEGTRKERSRNSS